MQNHNDDTIKTSDRVPKKNIPLISSERFVCERELGTEQNCNILTPTILAIIAFLSCSPGLLNWGPTLLDAGFLYRILSPTHLIPNWLNFLSTALYNSLTPPSSCGRHNFALIQSVHGQGYNILIFLDRMNLLFTQVRFLFWHPGWAVGQYAAYW